MRNLLCLLVGLALILELAGLAIAAPSVDGRNHVLASDTVVTGHVVAQRSKRFCDGFGGVWDITIQKGTHAISGTYTTATGVHRHGNRAKTGRKLDMTATGLSLPVSMVAPYGSNENKTSTKLPILGGYYSHGGGNSEDCDDICCIYDVILRCKDMP